MGHTNAIKILWSHRILGTNWWRSIHLHWLISQIKTEKSKELIKFPSVILSNIASSWHEDNYMSGWGEMDLDWRSTGGSARFFWFPASCQTQAKFTQQWPSCIQPKLAPIQQCAILTHTFPVLWPLSERRVGGSGWHNSLVVPLCMQLTAVSVP